MNGQKTSALGEVLIRCNNVLFIRAAAADGGDDDATTQTTAEPVDNDQMEEE